MKMGLKNILFGKKIEGEIVDTGWVMHPGSSGEHINDHTLLEIIDSSGKEYQLAVLHYMKGVAKHSEDLKEGRYISAKTCGLFRKILSGAFSISTGKCIPVKSYTLK